VKLLEQAHLSLCAGTRRIAPVDATTAKTLAPPAAAPLILRIGQDDNPEARETRLWNTYAALDLMRRAGYQPSGTADAMPAAAAPDQRRPCPERAASVLARAPQEPNTALLHEWLTLACQHQFSLPHALLPALLEQGVKHVALQPLIAACADERGRWLARQNETWRYVVAVPDVAQDNAALQSIWETGAPAERIAALLAWRHSAPDAAHVALIGAWKDESAENRAAFLRALAQSPVAKDEALAEAALDDKRKEVRAAAQDLLARLPGSQFVQRMLARAAVLLRVESKLLRNHVLSANLPAELDKQAIRDGIGADKHAGLGERAGWLADIVACVSPIHWVQSWGLEVPKVLGLFSGSEHSAALMTGVSVACARAPQSCTEWYRELITQWLATGKERFSRDFMSGLGKIPAEMTAHWLQVWVEKSAKVWRDDEPVGELLAQAAARSAQWPSALSQAVVRRLHASPAALNQPYSALRQHLPHFALRVDPRGAADYARGWPESAEDESAWIKARDEFNAMVSFRLDLQLSFTGESA
jgi:Family of unknown function (DUF5691)